MKNLITAVPCIVILLAILMEFVQMEAVYSKVIRAEAAIENFRQEVRAEGCVTGERGGNRRNQGTDGAAGADPLPGAVSGEACTGSGQFLGDSFGPEPLPVPGGPLLHQ